MYRCNYVLIPDTFKKMNAPVEIATTLDDLMRVEYMVQSGTILPDRPIYSILTGRHPAKMRGRGLDFEEVRQYVAGDDIRHIDWRVTARTNQTFSKIFNEEKERPTFTLLDQSAVMFFGSQRYVKSVTAAHIAALTAFYTIKRGDRFGGLIFSEEGHDYVVPKRSKSLVQHFLQLIVERNNSLLQRKTVKNNTNLLNEMLQRTQLAVTHDYVVVIITNILMMDDESKRYLRSIALHNNIIIVHIEDPMDKILPAGKLVLSDGERQILWNSQKNSVGAKYSSDYEHRLFALTEEFRRYGIPVSVIDTVRPVEEQVVERIGWNLKSKV